MPARIRMSEERTADTEFIKICCKESHFEEEKRRIALEKGKENANSTLTLNNEEGGAPGLQQHGTQPLMSVILQHKRIQKNSSSSQIKAKSTAGFSNNEESLKKGFRTRENERGTIIKNKARLVAQGYRQEEGVDYDDNYFAPLPEVEAIQTLFGICILSCFEDPAHPNKVYRVVNALMALLQPQESWKPFEADTTIHDADGVDCYFRSNVIWTRLRDIGNRGHIANGKPFLMITPVDTTMLDVLTALQQRKHIVRVRNSGAESFSEGCSRSTPNSKCLLKIVPLQGNSARPAQGTELNTQGTVTFRRPRTNSFSSQNDSQAERQDSETVNKGKAIGQTSHSLGEKSEKRKEEKEESVFSQTGRNKDEGNLSEEHHDQDDDNHKDEGILSEEHHDQNDHTTFCFYEVLQQQGYLTLLRKKKWKDTKQRANERGQKDSSDVKKRGYRRMWIYRRDSRTARQRACSPSSKMMNLSLLDISLNISKPRGLSILDLCNLNLNNQLKTDPKEKAKEIGMNSPKKKKLTLQQIIAWRRCILMREVARKVQQNVDQRKERKNCWKNLKKPQTEVYFEETHISCHKNGITYELP
ncbi:hypothetical protein Tco_1292156 [Tanacetum coccineum]